MTTLVRPPYDIELAAALEVSDHVPVGITPDMIVPHRDIVPTSDVAAVIAGRPLLVEDHIARASDGTEIIVSIVRRTDHSGLRGAVFHTHGGGMIAGDRFTGLERLADMAERYDAIVATVEYRLAPEFPDPTPVEDSYAGLVWFAAQSERFGFDPTRLMIMGASAGGGIAAGVTLLARDRGTPTIDAQMLMCPMLDDRNVSVSSRQYDGIGVWDRTSNLTGWGALLGDRFGTDDVSVYAAPGRATDLGGLPPTFIDVGSAEVFRDEDVDYATRIWAAGGDAELHVWAGAFHGFEAFAPAAAVSLLANEVRERWIARRLDD